MSLSKDLYKNGHTINRPKLCVVCLGKSKQNLTPNLIEQLKQFTSLFDNISPYDERVPSGICENCRNVLRDKAKGKGQNKQFKIPPDFCFTSIIINVSESNSELTCDCYLCTVVSTLYGSFSKINQPKK